MHELAIAQALVELACREAAAAGLAQVTAVRCRVGVLRQLEDDYLRDAFSAAGAGTRCAGARLDVEHVPLRAACPRCAAEFVVEAWNWTCPACGTAGRPLSGGDELDLVSFEAEAAP